MRKCDACGSDEIATVSTKYEGNYTECAKCGKRTYILSYEELEYRISELESQLFDTKTNMARQILKLQTELFVEREKRIAWQSERGEVER